MIPLEPTAITKLLQPSIQKEFDQLLSKLDPDRRLETAWNGPDGWLDWIINLNANFRQAYSYLNARMDNFEAHLQPVLEDHQFARIFKNFTFEAMREAIDERSRMLEHAAVGVGMLDPAISIEQKARIERTLRTLDPEDVLYLYGASRIPIHHRNSGHSMANFLNGALSGDVLVSSGCIRMEAEGSGGLGEGVWTTARITPLGLGVLKVLHTYTSVRTLPFIVPGREAGPQDRSEQEARQILNKIKGLNDFVNWSIRRDSGITINYKSSLNSAFRTLTFFMLRWADRRTRLEEIAAASTGTELTIELIEQPYIDEEVGSIQALSFDFTGPHDLLRYLADDCEATWYAA